MIDSVYEYRKLYGKTLGLIREYKSIDLTSTVYIDAFNITPNNVFIISGSQVLLDKTPVVFTTTIGGVEVETFYYILNATGNPTTAFQITVDGSTPMHLSGATARGTMIYNTTQYLIDLKRVISEQLTMLQSLLWRTTVFLQDPSYYSDNFVKSEEIKLVKFLTNYSPQWGGFGYNSAHTCRTSFVKTNLDTPISISTTSYGIAIGSNGIVYINGNTNVIAFSATGGTKIWEGSRLATTTIHSSPAIGYDGSIYIGRPDGLYKLNPLNGNIIWSDTSVNITTSPVIGPDGKIYVIDSSDNKLLTFNTNGSKVTLFSPVSNVSSSPAIGYDGTVYVVSNTDDVGTIRAIKDGTQLWNTDDVNTYPGIKNITTSVSVGSDGTIYCGDSMGNVYAICGVDGLIIANYNIYANSSPEICSTPAIGDDGTVYVTTRTKINAFKLKVNTVYPYQSNFYVTSTLFTSGNANLNDSLVIGGDGTIYVGLNNGKIQPFSRDLQALTILTQGTSPLFGSVIGANGALYTYNPGSNVLIFS